MKVKEITELFPEAELLQIKPNAKYIVAIPSNRPLRECIFIQDYLASHGVQAIVVPCSDLKLFELEKTIELPKKEAEHGSSAAMQSSEPAQTRGPASS